MSKLFDYLSEKHVFQDIKIPTGELDGIEAPGSYYPNLNGEQGFISTWLPICEPFLMEPEPVWHDFDQMCYFAGGDAAHMDELGGVAEFYLGDEDGNLEKFIITKPTVIYIKAGMIHCPLDFKEIYDRTKPMLFQDMTFAGVYRRFRPGSNEPLNEKFEPIEKTW
jgi:hypothetical protein